MGQLSIGGLGLKVPVGYGEERRMPHLGLPIPHVAVHGAKEDMLLLESTNSVPYGDEAGRLAQK